MDSVKKDCFSNNIALGVDIGKTKIAVGAVDPVTKAISFFLQDFQTIKTKDAILDTTSRLIETALKNYPTVDVGVGVFGVVDHCKGTIISSRYIDGWKDFNLAAFLRSRFGFSNITIDNDVIVAAVGEYWLNYDGKNISIFSAGTSIGIGSIINGKIFRGSHNLSGQIAHLNSFDKKHTISQLCGGKGISDRLYDELGIRVGAKEIIESAQNNECNIAKNIVEEAAHIIAKVIILIQNMLDPNVIICSGSLLSCNEYFYDLVLSNLSEYPQCYLENNNKLLNIVKSDISQHIGILGGVALCKKYVI